MWVELQAERQLWTRGLMELPHVHTARKGRVKVGRKGKGKPCRGYVQEMKLKRANRC